MKIIKTIIKFALLAVAGLFVLGLIISLLQTPEQRARIAASNEKARQERIAQEAAAAQKTAAKKAQDQADAAMAERVGRKKKIADAWKAPVLMYFYKQNEVKADQTLKGQRITVSGKVEKIGKDILNTPYVTLKTDDPIASVQVMFDRGNENAIADLVPGRSIVLEGKVSGKMMNVILTDGSLVAD